jgi:type IX secretion system PorP/SprF family membrane protein
MPQNPIGMKKYYSPIFYCLLIFLLVQNVKAQDLTFSQFYEQPLLRNPALAGVFTGDLRVSTVYRDQWSSITVPFRTEAMSTEYKRPIQGSNDVLSLGAQMTLDQAGDIQLKRTQFLPFVNYSKSLSDDKDSYLSIAFMGGPVYSQFDPTLERTRDQLQSGSYNPNATSSQIFTNNGYNYWDLATGISYSSSYGDAGRFYIGAGYAHFNKPIIHSVTGTIENFLYPKITFNIGLNTPITDRNRIIAFAGYFTQNGYRQLLGGFLYGFDFQEFYNDDPYTIYFGSFLRWGDAFVPVIKMDFKHLTIGVSYEVNVSKLKTVSNFRGGLDLTASYHGFFKVTNSTLEKLMCTRF